MPRKILFILAIVFFIGGLVFGFIKFTKAAQAPTLNAVTPISACGFNLNFNAPETANRFEIQTSKNQTFSPPNLTFNATDENGNQVSGSGNLSATTTARLLRDQGYTGSDFYNPSTRYYFHIKLYPADGGAVSGWSNILDSVTNALVQPGAPQNLRAEGRDGGSKIYIAWERGNPTPPAFDAYGGFEIWRAASSNGGVSYGNFSLIQRVPARHNDGSLFLDYEDNNNGNWLNPDYSYKYYLKAYQSDRGCRDDQVVISEPSEEVIVPVRPDGLAANAPVATRIELSWNDNSEGAGNETGFEIWRSVGNNANYVFRYLAEADANSFIDSDVQPNTNYFYKIRGCRGSNPCSAFSNEADAATGAAPVDDLAGYLYFVDHLDATGDVYLSWDAVIGNTYTVLRKDLVTGVETAVPGCSGNGISECRSSGISLGVSYEYRLRIERAGNVTYSNVVQLNLDVGIVLKGTAWTWAGDESGIGWVKFRSDEGGEKKYSVQVDVNGLMSGAAWASPGYGWLSFNKSDLAGCPSGVCEARLDFSSGELSGWAKFLSWDGWVKLKGENYGVTFASTTRWFAGAGWGNDVSGWLAFGDPCLGCTVAADLIGEEEPQENRPPIVTDVILEVGPSGDLWCAENPFYRVRWAYADPDRDLQDKAEIEIWRSNAATSTFATTSIGTDISIRLYDPLAYLRSNTSYLAKVRAYDGELWSNWISSNATTTPTHYPPLVDFSWSPRSMVVGQPVTFRDRSPDRSGDIYPPENWSFDWLFNNAVPEHATGSIATAVFNVLPSDVSLTVDDSGGGLCSLIQQVGSGLNVYKRRVFRER